MGIIRKATSLSTMGLVSYRSDAERSHKVAKQTRNAARLNAAQNMKMIKLQQEQLEMERQAQAMRGMQLAAQLSPAPMAPPSLPPGWYADPTDNRAVCWWDGFRWHPQTKHFPAPDGPMLAPPVSNQMPAAIPPDTPGQLPPAHA